MGATEPWITTPTCFEGADRGFTEGDSAARTRIIDINEKSCATQMETIRIESISIPEDCDSCFILRSELKSLSWTIGRAASWLDVAISKDKAYVHANKGTAENMDMITILFLPII